MTALRRIVLAVAALGAAAGVGAGAQWLFAGGPDSRWHDFLGRLGVPNSCRLVLESPELDPADFRITFYSDDGSFIVFDGRMYRSFPGVYGSNGFEVDYRGRRVFTSNDFSPRLGGNRFWIYCRSESNDVSCGDVSCIDHLDGV